MKHKFLLITLLMFAAVTCSAMEDKQQYPSVIESPSESYTIIKKLGEGLFSDVFAVENAHGKRFALKAYKNMEDKELSGPFFDPLRDIEREYQRGQMLDHPQFPKLLEYFFDHSEEKQYVGYLVMELVKGTTLYQSPRNAFSQKQAILLTQQLIDALQYAHSLDLMFLDLHGNNVMIDETMNFKIIDLASFFSYEELKEFFQKEVSSSTIQAKNITPAAKKLGPLREEKLKRFFSENPKAFEKVKRRIQRNLALGAQMRKDAAPPVDTDIVRATFDPLFFSRLAEICRLVIEKSQTPKEEKVDLFVDIKRIAWDYEESAAEGEEVSIEPNFEKLRQTLES